MDEKSLATGFTGEPLPGSTHICIIYDDDDVRRRMVSEYLAAGLRRGELVRYFADSTAPETIRAWLTSAGVEVGGAEARGSFSVSNAATAYCGNGPFDPQAMIAASERRYASAERAGYPAVRSTGEMTWVLKGLPGSDRFLEYEALLNGARGEYPHSGMCQYDARLFDGATLFRVLQVHPFMLAQGQIVRNPYYLKPEELLRGA